MGGTLRTGLFSVVTAVLAFVAALLFVPGNTVETENIVISFDTDGGSFVESEVLSEAGTITLSTPSKDGYTFDKWVIGETEVTSGTVFSENTTVVAVWIAGEVTITLDENGGNDLENIGAYLGDFVQLPDAEKAGYAFNGWLDENGELVTAVQATENMTLTASFTMIAATEYSVVLQSAFGFYDPQTVEVGSTINLPTPEVAGYTFNGWTTESDGSGTVYTDATPITGDTVLYAYFTVDTPQYDVVYLVNGSETEVDAQVYNEGDTLVLPESEASRIGYSFIGWAYGIDELGKIVYADESMVVNEDLTMVAMFEYYLPMDTFSFDSIWNDDANVKIGYEICGLNQGWNIYDYGYNEETDLTDLVLPSEYQGLPILDLGCGTFDGFSELGDVYIPDTYMRIRQEAFFDTEIFGTLYIGESVNWIAGGAFASSYINNIDFGENSELSFIGGNTFADTNFEEEFVLPASVVYIQYSAFNNVIFDNGFSIEENSRLIAISEEAFYGSNIDAITFPDTLLYIGYGSFDSTSIETIHIPESVVYIHGDAFRDSDLTTVTFDENSNIMFIGADAFGDLVDYDNNDDPRMLTLGGGRFLIDYRFEYAMEHITYTTGQIVNHNGDLYVALKEVQGIEPGTDETAWELYTFGYPIYTDSVGYNAGDIVYSSGSYYEALQNMEGNPLSDTAYWTTIDPEEIDHLALFAEVLAEEALYDIEVNTIDFGENLVAISENALEDFTCNECEVVTLPDSLVLIDHNAFYYADFGDTAELIIPSSVKHINSYAFEDMDAFKVTFEDDPTSLRMYNYDSILNDSDVIEVYVGEGVVFLGEDFLTGSTVEVISLPASLKYLTPNMLYSAYLTTVNVAEGAHFDFITSDDYCFCSDPVVDPSSPYAQADANGYVVVGNVLTSLLDTNQNIDFALPAGVDTLAPDMSMSDDAFNSVDLTGVVKMYESVFTYNNLNADFTITIPNTIKVIDDYSFDYSQTATITFEENIVFDVEAIANAYNDDDIIIEIDNCPSWADDVEPDENGLVIIGNALVCYYDTLSDFNDSYYDSSTAYVVGDIVTQEFGFGYFEVIQDVTGVGPSEDTSGVYYKEYEITITIPEGVEIIYNDVFEEENISAVTLPSTLKLIGDNAFSDNLLTSMTIPAAVEYIYWDAFEFNDITEFVFEDASNLKYVGWEILYENPVLNDYVVGDFIIIDGILISYIGSDSKIVVPEGVTMIASDAFLEAFKYGHSITLPSTLKVLSSYSFSWINYSELVFHPDTQLDYVGTHVFAGSKFTTLDLPAAETMLPHALAFNEILLPYAITLNGDQDISEFVDVMWWLDWD